MDAIYDADWVGHCVPHKLIVNILHRLPPSTLAVARVVCRKWHAAIADNNLLPADYHHVKCGLFVSNYGGHWGSSSIAPTAKPWLKFANIRHNLHRAPANHVSNHLLPSCLSNVDGHWVSSSIATPAATSSRPQIGNERRDHSVPADDSNNSNNSSSSSNNNNNNLIPGNFSNVDGHWVSSFIATTTTTTAASRPKIANGRPDHSFSPTRDFDFSNYGGRPKQE